MLRKAGAFTNVSNRHKGIMMILSSAFFFACMNVCVRMSGDHSVFQKVVFRNLVATLVALVVLLRSGEGFRPARKGNLWPLLARTLFGTFGMLGNFYAVDRLLLPDANMLNKMSPFFAALFCAIFLGEKLKGVQVLTLLGAFGGAMFIIKPTLSNMVLVPSVVGFLGGVCAGMAYTMVRLLGRRGERGSYIVFFFSAVSCILLLPPAILTWTPVTLTEGLALIGTGLTAAGGQFCITAAYRYAPAREISVYDYAQVLYSALFGILFFGDLPDGYSILGYIIICGMAILNFWYNNRHRPEET